jgi:hypothetical protein
MLVLYDETRDCVLEAHPTWRDRLGVHVSANRLDRALANGASPDSTVALALRAQTLVRPEERATLARGIERILAQTPHLRGGRAPSSPSPSFYRRVQSVADELRDLVRCLRTRGPVSAQGIAQVRVLLTDGAGPLHYGGGDLRLAVQAAVLALDPPSSWT